MIYLIHEIKNDSDLQKNFKHLLFYNQTKSFLMKVMIRGYLSGKNTYCIFFIIMCTFMYSEKYESYF